MKSVQPKAKEGRQTPGPTPPRPGPDDHNSRMRQLAHQRLERLFDEAVSARFYGRVQIEISFENGRALVVHRRIDGVDK